jgi:hypothetical protein
MVLALEREPRQKKRWGQVVARAWSDDGFRQRLLTEPASVLCEAGIEIPPGVTVRVVQGDTAEATEEETCFWLPPNPADEELVEDDLGLPPGAYMGGTPCVRSGRTRPANESRLSLPARPAADDLVEDDLGLPPGAYLGTTCLRTIRTTLTRPV